MRAFLAALVLTMVSPASEATIRLPPAAPAGLVAEPHFTPALVVDEDERRTLGEYANEHELSAAQVRRMFAATVQLRCKRGWASADFVGSDRLVVTAGHVLGGQNCPKRAGAQGCRVVIPHDDRQTLIGIRRVVATGLKCPTTTGPFDDWAILELQRPAGVPPYRLPPRRDPRVEPGQRITAVAVGEADFFRGGVVAGDAQSIGDCHVRGSYSGPGRAAARLVAMDCSAGERGSGGAILSAAATGRRVILGVIKGGSHDPADEAKYIAQGRPYSCLYDVKSCATVATLISGEFYRRLAAAIARSRSPAR